jgi:hypothetical protein
MWLAADDFYCVLQGWHSAFEAEWASTSKASTPMSESAEA